MLFHSQFVVTRDIKVYAKVDGGGSAPVDIQNISTLEDLKSAVVERLEIVSPKIVKVRVISILEYEKKF